MDNGILDSANPFEADVAKQLGMSRGTAKKFRNEKLIGGTDWIVDGRRVVYLPSGFKKIKKAARAAANLKPEQGCELIVKRLVINRHILLATKKNGGAEVRVKVRDSALYAPGMVMQGCMPEGVNLYRYTGKPPRKKGRW